MRTAGASEEYFKAIPVHKLDDKIKVITCVFLDGGKVKSVYAKRARGLMARYVCMNQALHAALTSKQKGQKKSLDAMEELRRFNLEGYAFDAAKSTDVAIVFSRAKAPEVAVSSGKKRKAADDVE